MDNYKDSKKINKEIKMFHNTLSVISETPVKRVGAPVKIIADESDWYGMYGKIKEIKNDHVIIKLENGDVEPFQNGEYELVPFNYSW